MTRSQTQAEAPGPPTTGNRGVVIIPARNEEASIGAVCDEVRRLTGWDLVVINDASTDATGTEALAAGAVVLPLAVRLGAWGASQTGLRYALGNGYRYVVTMDADGQHLADFIPDLLAPVLADEADVTIGSCTGRGSPSRRIAWRFFRWLTGLDVDDLTSGFRIYNHRTMELLASAEASLLEYQDIGVLTLLRANGLRIQEVPVTMQPRHAGHSRIFGTWGAVFYYLLYTGILCLSKWNPADPRARGI